MAEFSPFSSASDSEIDQILAEAMDQCVLEQVAAINCSSFSSSLLPSHLETRFQKLKTFPSSSASKSFLDLGYESNNSRVQRKPSDGEGKMGNSPSGGSEVSKFEEGKMGNLPSGYVKVSKFEGNLSDDEGKMVNSPSGRVKASKFEGNSASREGKIGNSPSEKVKVPKFDGNLNDDDDEGKMGNFPYGQVKFSKFEGDLSDREGKKVNSPSGQVKVSKFDGNWSDGEGKMGNLPHEKSKVSSFEKGLGHRKGKKGKSQGGYVSSPSDSSSECMDSPKLKRGKHGRKGKMGNLQPWSSSTYSDSEEEIAKRSSGCLCFSPKHVSRKKSNGGSGRSSGRNKGSEIGFGWGKDEELLSDLRSFSSKEQKKRMKEAIMEEEKINKEAEKIIKWAKQVSARMDYDISDNDDDDVDFRRH